MSHTLPDIKMRSTARPRALQLQSIDIVAQNPLDVFARIALAENYDRERLGDNELHLTLPGTWCDHQVTIGWDPQGGLVQIYLLFDFRIPDGRSDAICRLISLLNSRLSVGHFDFWDKDDALVYRQSVCLSGDARLNTAQAMTMLAAALEAAEKGYPASQYMLWGGKSAREAIDCAILERAARGSLL